MLGEFARVKALGLRLGAGAVLLGCCAGRARAAGPDDFDPALLREAVFAGIVSCAFLAAVAIWSFSALRRLRRRFRRRMHFMATALNYMNLGVSMVDSRGRLRFCNDAYLDIHRLSRSEITPKMPLDEVLALRSTRGTFDQATANFAKDGEETSECVRDLDDGRSVIVWRHRLPAGGWVSTYADFTEQRKLARQLASTKLFLESVIDNIPVCVAVKNISDRRYVLANRAFEQFSRLSRDAIVGSTAEEIFTRGVGASRDRCR